MANFSIFTLLGIFLVHLSSSSNVSNPGTERSAFDLALFCNISKYTPRNFVISPISLKLSLLMIAEGAAGNSAQEIRAALHYGTARSLDMEGLADEVTYMKAKKRKVIFKMANQLFMANNYTINPDYFTRLKKFYLTDVSLVDMKKPNETAIAINSWAKRKTGGRIPNIIPEFSVKDNSVLFVANAAFFKGIWRYKFRKNLTFQRCFYQHGYECEHTLMMMNVGLYNYWNATHLGARAIQLYYKDRKHFMMILLPNNRNGVDELIEKLRFVRISDIASRLKPQRVLLEMPKFNISYFTGMVQPLKTLNIRDIFGDNADLPNMVTSNSNFRVNDIIHAARITVFEKGIYAAAATETGTVHRAPPDYEEFIIEHPFVFFVMEHSTGSILFAGKVMDPDINN